MRLRRKKRVVLALGAGGARGLAHVGVLRALHEADIPIDGIAGVSFGAIVGALYSIYTDVDTVEARLKEYMDSPVFKEAEREIESLDTDRSRSFFEKIQATIKKGYFYTMALYRKSLLTPESFVMNMKELVGDLAFSHTKIPFKCQAVDLITGNPIVFSDGDLCAALQASSAVPGFFPPVIMHTMLLVDGGVAEMIPVHLARTFKPDYIIGVDVHKDIEPIEDPDNELGHSFDVVFRSYDITRDFMDIYLTQELDTVICPELGTHTWYDFASFDTYVQAGYKAAQAKIPEIRRRIFWLYI
jgi:NTE family protein